MSKIKPLIVVFGGILACIIIFFSFSTRIDAGHEGIKVKQYGTSRGVQDISLVTGRVWYNPFTESIYEFPTFVQTADYEAFSVNARDGSVFQVDPTISFKVKPGHTPQIFKEYRKSLKEVTSTTLYNYVKDAFRIQFNKYTTDSMISNREGFETSVQLQLSHELDRQGIELLQLTSGIIYPASITEAIDAKNRAVQQALQVENELKVTEANARKLIIQAEAEAKANQLRLQSLTPLLIQQQFIEKWDGRTPLYGSAPVLFKNVQ
ncbi:regulator of protease activity HflC (stomatin/prohibitin superfamily) [Chitinophaga skermanii]|uniref:Regulator of protease activity HflC (Stomatin/prohibitin superfamily) n=1 Tax=Chitinophaga skermanii TaxID=331697 RepID=A0A327QV19_9BACT|nr:SPFH domain-containing protein [Chitinophaga skermanii]RAJ08459.1 regulator of protease activity HflC (stomatin/prohibitin superfamily) [Chitinophaga skermanii]